MAASEDQRKTRQVPSLKIIFLKELKFMDLCRSLLKTSFFPHDFIIYFSFMYIENCAIYKAGDI